MSSTFSGTLFRNNCSVNRNFPEHYSVTFRNSRTTSWKFPVYGKKSFRKSGKGTVSVISRDPLGKERNARFTAVHFKPTAVHFKPTTVPFKP